MNKKLIALALTGALTCGMVLPALAVSPAAPSDTAASVTATAQEVPALPASVLYYGTVQQIVKDENGQITQLWLTSEQYGEYVMNLSAETVWIDSGNRTASDPSTLQEGESVYVFHSPIATFSLPPQSPAFAVVRNIPMDISCAQYHEVEEVSLVDGQLTITTDNGGLLLRADQNTPITLYGSDETVALEDIQPGSHLLAWYGVVAASYPGQASADCLMLLPQ